MHKRIAALILAGVMSMMLLAGCDKYTTPQLDPNRPVLIQFWHHYNGYQKTVVDKLVEQFNRTEGLEQGIVVEAHHQGNVLELHQKVLDAAQGKLGAEPLPHLITTYADTAYELGDQGLLVQLRSYFTQQELDAFNSSFLQEGDADADGIVEVLPVSKSSEVLAINQGLWGKFASETGASLQQLSTMEGLVDVARQYYQWIDSKTPDVPNDGKAFYSWESTANYLLTGSMQLGQPLIEEGTAGRVSVNLNKEVMRKLWDNYHCPMIMGWMDDGTATALDSVRVADTVGAVISSSHAVYFPDQMYLDDFKSFSVTPTVLAVPQFESGTPTVMQQGAGMAIVKSDDAHEYAASLFLKWVTQPERNAVYALESGYLPTIQEALTPQALNRALKQQQESRQPLIEAVIDMTLQQMNECQVYVSKGLDGAREVREVLESFLKDTAKADRAVVEEQLSQGVSLQEATQWFMSDEYFDQWYSQLEQKLARATGGN